MRMSRFMTSSLICELLLRRGSNPLYGGKAPVFQRGRIILVFSRAGISAGMKAWRRNR
jgi:hypothetical protein